MPLLTSLGRHNLEADVKETSYNMEQLERLAQDQNDWRNLVGSLSPRRCDGVNWLTHWFWSRWRRSQITWLNNLFNQSGAWALSAFLFHLDFFPPCNVLICDTFRCLAFIFTKLFYLFSSNWSICQIISVSNTSVYVESAMISWLMSFWELWLEGNWYQ